MPSPLQLHHVSPDRRQLYGLTDITIYATTEPARDSCLANPLLSTYTIPKKIFVLGDSQLEFDFEAAYEGHLHDKIVSNIRATLPDAKCALSVLRLGFKAEPRENPITLHITVADDSSLSDDQACKIVADVSGMIRAANRCFSKVCVDVCLGSGLSRNRRPPKFFLMTSNPEVYDSPTPLPYSSSGQANKSQVGTLGMYIQHKDPNGQIEFFELGCAHVLDPQAEFSEGLTPRRPLVNSPAEYDHIDTINSIERELILLKLQAIPFQEEIAALEEILQKAKQYNIVIGEVYGTSGSGRMLRSGGHSDWAIVKITKPLVNIENKYVRTTGPQFHSFDYQHDSSRIDLNDDSRIDLNTYAIARQYFAPGPKFKPIRENVNLKDLKIVWKPRSRTTAQWTVGKVSRTRHTKISPNMMFREWSFVSLDPEGALSANGDSGSILLDEEFQPLAMIWGGVKKDVARGLPDLTYASPLDEIMRDIEECMHWAEGSVSMVSSS